MGEDGFSDTGGDTCTAAGEKVSGTLIAKMTASGSTSLILTWNKVTGAEGYDVFFVKCGKGKPALVKSFKGNKTFRWKKTKLKKKTAYKALVKAYITKNGKKKYVLSSPQAHVYTSGGTENYANVKSVTLAKSRVTLKKGGKYKIKAAVNKTDPKKRLMPEKHTLQLRYISSNKKIATVSRAGRITAKAAGSCKVYVIAQNGAKKTLTVTVR